MKLALTLVLILAACIAGQPSPQATSSANPQPSGSQSGPQSSSTANPQQSGQQQASGTANPQQSGQQQASGTVNPQQSGQQQASGTLNPQQSGQQQASGTRNPQQSGQQQASGTVGPLPSGQQPSGTVGPLQSGRQQASGTVGPLPSGQQPSGTFNPNATGAPLKLSDSNLAFKFMVEKDALPPGLTPTPSPSQSAGFATTASIVVSDSIPSATLSTWLSACPVSSQLRTVHVSCDGVAQAASGVTITQQGAPDQAIQCDPTSSNFRLPLTMTTSTGFRSPASTYYFGCTLAAASGQRVANTTLRVSVLQTLWPLFYDAVVVTPNGICVSSLSGSVNATLAFLSSCFASLSSNVSSSSYGASNSTDSAGCSLAYATTNAILALGVVTSTYSTIPLPIPGANTTKSSFSITLSTPTIVVLRARAPSFSATTRVRLGGILCNQTVASPNGLWVAFLTPPIMAVCGTSDNCRATLTVGNPANGLDASDPAPLSRRRRLVETGTTLGAEISCPPFCPDVLSAGSVYPAPLNPNGSAGSFIPATLVQTSQGPVSQPVSLAASASGFYFSAACAVPGRTFTSVLDGACSNASDPSSINCAFGSGSSCSVCPTGALCPGGNRLWPRVGFYLASQYETSVEPCDPPATTRCVGWSSALGETICGTNYRRCSYLCRSCADGAFLKDDGTCAACPAISSGYDRYSGLVLLLAVIIAFGLALFGTLQVLVRFVSGRRAIRDSHSLKHLRQLIVWLIMTVQIVSQVSRSTLTLPALLQVVYGGVALIQLEGIVSAPSCVGTYPFATEVGLMGMAVACWVVTVLIYYACPWRSARQAGKATMTISLLLAPVAIEKAVALIQCSSASVSGLAVTSLDGGEAYGSLAATATDLVSVPLLSSDPYFVCFNGQHKSAGIFASICIAIYVASLPSLTLLWLWRDPRRRVEVERVRSTHAHRAAVLPAPASVWRSLSLKNPRSVSWNPDALARPSRKRRLSWTTEDMRAGVHRDPILSPFMEDSGYGPHAWYFRHLDLGVATVLSVLQATLAKPKTEPLIETKVFLICLTVLSLCFLVVYMKPYDVGHEWKLPVRAALLLLAAACAAQNAANTAVSLGLGGASLAESVVGGAYFIFVLFILTALILLAGFAFSVFESAARVHAEEVEAAAAAAAASAAASIAAEAVAPQNDPEANPTNAGASVPPPDSGGGGGDHAAKGLRDNTPHLGIAISPDADPELVFAK